jgi:SAM-dependent methyltransferase
MVLVCRWGGFLASPEDGFLGATSDIHPARERRAMSLGQDPEGHDGMRFGFGKNWADFIDKRLSPEVIDDSQRHMSGLLHTSDLSGKVFLDIGCGSGIHSLAALRMGAERIISFDYDADSVATTKRVREFAGAPTNWEVMQGSVLDPAFMTSLPKADLVYSWGVLHHTGDMWSAVRHAGSRMKDDGVFYIALYSSDNYVDPTPDYWMKLKRAYNLASKRRKRWMEWLYMIRFHFFPSIKAGQNPLNLMRDYGERGMTYWTDVRDWLGGWPMDFASLHETQQFCAREFGFSLVNLKTGEGCTEYIFTRPGRNLFWDTIASSRRQKLLSGPFVHLRGKAYHAPLPDLASSADHGGELRRSQLMLYEDGAMLGLAHSVHDHVARFAGGRFSHWGDSLVFSSSDGSDPNTNGRAYSYCERF